MKCPICSSTQLVRETRDLAYTYKGENTRIPEVSGQYCPGCGENMLDADEAVRVSAAMLKFNGQVDAA